MEPIKLQLNQIVLQPASHTRTAGFVSFHLRASTTRRARQQEKEREREGKKQERRKEKRSKDASVRKAGRTNVR